MENKNMNNFSVPHIYKRTIVATGKSYIGKHKGTNLKYKGSGVDYLKDYKLYVKNPELDLIEEILEYVNDLSELNKREEYWLELYNVKNNPLFYNKTNRHRGWSQVSEEQRKKLSESKKGKKMSLESSEKKRIKMIGISKHTNESKKLISNKNKKNKSEEFRIKLRKPKTEEHIQNILKGKEKFRKSILQYDLQGNFIREYLCALYAAKELKIKQSSISQCCLGKLKTYKGFIWKFKN